MALTKNANTGIWELNEVDLATAVAILKDDDSAVNGLNGATGPRSRWNEVAVVRVVNHPLDTDTAGTGTDVANQALFVSVKHLSEWWLGGKAKLANFVEDTDWVAVVQD